LLLKKILPITLLLAVFTACSSKVDTSSMTAEQHYNYAMSLYNDEDYEYAEPEFKSILLNNAGSTIYDDAQFYLASTYFKRKQYYLSAYEFSKLIRDIPASSFVPEAQFMLAESYYKQSPHYSLDQTFTKKAIEEYQAFVTYFPTNAKAVEAEAKIKELNNKLAEKEFKSGLVYERMEYLNAAIKYYTVVVDTYHDSNWAPEALYNRMRIELDKNQVQKVQSDIGLFLSRYPESPFAKDVKSLDAKLAKK